MRIKILGRRCAVGEDCKECRELRERVEGALAELGIEGVEVGYPKDLEEFLSYGVVLTPALLVNDEIKSAGRVPTKAVLRRILEEAE